MSKKNLEKAINDYVHQLTEGETFPTGWILVASLAPPSGDNSVVDSYINITSDGLPAHTQMGLIEMARNDMRNVSMLGHAGTLLRGIFGGSDEDEEYDED